MTRTPAFAVAVCAALALAACAAPAPRETSQPEPATATATPPPPVTATPTPAEKTARLAPEPAAPPPDPDRLRGLTGDEVQKLIGAPQFARADDPAALWRYRGGGCLLDLYLHADGAAYRVTYFQFRADPRGAGGAKAQVDPRACFAALLQAREDQS